MPLRAHYERPALPALAPGRYAMGVMPPLAVSLIFEPQAWTVGLPAVAALLLAWEGGSMSGPAGRGRANWRLLALAVLAGVAAAAMWGTWAAGWTPVAKALSGPLSLPAKSAALVTLPALAAAAMLAATGLVRRMAAAAAGQVGVAAAVGALLRGGTIASLAGLTAFWVPQGAIVSIGAAATAWAVRSYRRTTSPLARRSKVLLLALRLAAVALLTAWALRPGLEYRHEAELRTTVLLCADTSRSMQRRDVAPAPGGAASAPTEPVSRIEALRSAMAAAEPALAALHRQADVELVPFEAAPGPAVRFRDERGWAGEALGDANGEATALGDALSEIYDAYAAQRRKVAAVVVFSDGCNNTADVLAPDKLAALMAGRGVPLHAVGVGSEKVTGATRTLSVRDLAAPDEVDAFNRFTIAAAVETMGLANRRVKVTCRFGDEEVGSEELAVTDVRSTHPVRFVHVPLQAGFHRAAVTAEVLGAQPRDLAGQQRDSKLVHVVDREMRVLYVEGKFRYETKYVAQALAAARRFSLDRRVLLQPLAGKQPAALSESLDDWLAYHAIIFGDVAATHFSRKQLEILRDLVGKYGKGFAMIGGDRSFGRGGWAGTPLADIMPVDLAASAGEIDAPVKVTPTREGQQHDLMRIGEAGLDVAGDWARLDPLPGANRLGGLKPAAEVLAQSPAGEPLIVAQTYGKGRSLAIAFDATWRWVLNKHDTAELQRRFWRQVALFLAAPKGNVWIVTDKTNYDLRRLKSGAETVGYRAGVEDSHGRPLLSAPVRVTLTDPQGRETKLAPTRPDEKKGEKMYTGRLAPPTAGGTYVMKIAAVVAGKELTAEHRFEVIHRDLESLEVLANFGLLRQMADRGGGRFLPLQRLGELLKDLRLTARPEKRDVPVQHRLAAEMPYPWFAIAALIALLCAEWAIRKRKGLV